MAAGIPANVIAVIRQMQQRNRETLMAEKDSCITMLKHSLSTVESSGLHQMMDQAKIGFRSEFIEKFETQKLIGSGSYGCVFQARNKLDERDYAVKRIPIQNRIEQALREIRMMAQLDHPGIIRINNSWVECPPEDWQDDREMLKNSHLKLPNVYYKSNTVFLYIQMQLCKYSLSDWLERNELPSTRSITRLKPWFKQIINAVNYIHERNLIHRDLKPSNILVVESHDDAVLKLGEFGLSTDTEDDRRTMLYMSPEQGSGFCEYDSKTDIFTLGLIFTELCVVMNSSERSEIFDNYRSGMQCDLIQDERTGKIIRSLTQVDAKLRPSCKEILEDSFLADEQASLTHNSSHHFSLTRPHDKNRFFELENSVPPFYIPSAYNPINSNYRCTSTGAGAIGIIRKFDSSSIDEPSVMIKKFSTPFRDRERGRQVLREINLLRTIKHENIVRLLSVYTTDTGANSLECIYHVTEFAGEPLSEKIRAGRYTMPFVKKWMRELLIAVQHLHSIAVIHRDLKPSNICIDADNKLTLIGFGRARVINHDSIMSRMTSDQTYASIEQQVDWAGPYDEKVDIWSISTILCEMITGQPLFGGNNTLRQQIDSCGSVDQAVLNKITKVFERNQFAHYSNNKQRTDFIAVLRNAMMPGRLIENADIESNEYPLRDFIDKTLQFDPDMRMTAVQALNHPFLLTQLPWEHPLPDNDNLALQELRLHVWNEIRAAPSPWSEG